LPVEHALEHLSERRGVTVTPIDVPKMEGERRAARVFVNVFAMREALNEHPSDSKRSSE